MTLIIVTILVFCYVLLPTESVTNVNKAAVAMFAGTVGWMLYISYGSDFVMNMHSAEYSVFLNGMPPTSSNVKQFIAQNIFLSYVGKASEIVLFLLATMTIVEILNNNGCFDFITQLMRTRHSKKLLWTLSIVTFVISANLDNLTTTVMMVTMMHSIVPSRRQRMLYGSAILLSANCGGALTVIGDPAGLVLWNMGAVTATDFSQSLALPCLVAWVIPLLFIGKALPENVDTAWIVMPYRGDDTRLNVWQRLLMLLVGIGGLWFIPTFHNITKLSPFLGALCVLSVLWIVNEIFNRKLMNTEQMIQRRVPRVLQYGVIQMMLFVMGMMLAVGVVSETGAIDTVRAFIDQNIHNVWIVGASAGVVSSVLDNFATAISFITIHPIEETNSLVSGSDYLCAFVPNGQYWKIVAYCSAIGGNVLTIGSVSGLALMKIERMHVGWYFKHVGLAAMIGGIIGLSVLWVTGIY